MKFNKTHHSHFSENVSSKFVPPVPQGRIGGGGGGGGGGGSWGSANPPFRSVDYYVIAITALTKKRTKSTVELPMNHCASSLQSIQ